MKKLTKQQLISCQRIWKKLRILQDQYMDEVQFLECELAEKTGIDDIEFFWCDGWAGIGNASSTIKLIQPNENDELGYHYD